MCLGKGSAESFRGFIVRLSSGVFSLAVCLLVVVGCDLGDRDTLPDAGDAGDPDADSDTDSDTDSDAGPDASDWRYADAGDHWDDGTITVDGPCNNDCAYVYEMTMYEFDDDVRGKGMFEMRPGAYGQTEARSLDSTIYIMHWSWPHMERYRQRMISDYLLDPGDQSLIYGEVTLYNMFCDETTLKQYTFSHDTYADEFTYTVDTEGRNWTRTLSTQVPPLVMFNHREYPFETRGAQSALFAHLLHGRYNWAAGGVQQIPIFSPEMERLDVVDVEKQGSDTLVVRFPVDSAKAPWVSQYNVGEVYDTNNVPFTYEFDIPVHMNTRDHFEWDAVSSVSPELNLSLVPPSTEILGPTPSGGYVSTEQSFTLSSVTLAGQVDDPNASGLHRAVVMLPGWDHITRRGEVGAVDMYEQLADRLAGSGTLVVRVDARGMGGSGGALGTSTLADLVEDGVDLVNQVAAMGQVDPTEVFVLTTGPGAHIAAQVANDSTTNVAGIIMITPVGDAYDAVADEIWEHYLTNAGASSNYIAAKQNEINTLFQTISADTYGGDYYMGHDNAGWQSLLAQDLVATPTALPPTLIVDGTEDHLYPPALASDLATALSGAGTAVTHENLSGLTHGLTSGTAAGLWPEHGSMEEVAPSAVTAINNWLDSITGGI